jgi:hypothetical protein
LADCRNSATQLRVTSRWEAFCSADAAPGTTSQRRSQNLRQGERGSSIGGENDLKGLAIIALLDTLEVMSRIVPFLVNPHQIERG